MTRRSQKRDNRVIALIASLMLAISLVPAIAFAEGVDDDNSASLKTGALAAGSTRGSSVASGTCGDGLTWELTGEDDDLTLTISGTGAMTNYQFESAPWEEDYRDSVKTLTIGNGVTSIGNYAFYECKSLESVTIPASVTSIGQSAFAQCDALTEITIPSSVTSIGSDAFFSCNMLEDVSIGSGVTSIGESAFKSIAWNATITIDTYETKVSKGDNWSGGAAVFWTKVKVATTANPENGGEVTITGGEQVEGGRVFKKSDSGVALLTAVPSEGHCFTSWTENGKVVVDGDGNPVGTTYTFAITNDTVDRNLKANFGPYSVTVVNGKADPETAKMGDKVTVTADEPKSGKAFSGWTAKGLEDESLGDPKESKASFKMPGNDVTVTANYCDVLINETGSDSGIGERDYIGGPIKPTLEVSLKGVGISFGANDYTTTFTDNVDIGTATAKVTLNDPYVGSGEAQFKISPASFSDATVKVAAENRVYDGTEFKPDPTVTWHDMKVAENDYAAKYTDYVRAGTATVAVTGKHNFKNDYTKTAMFQIKARQLTITADSASKVYDGKPLTSDGFTSEGLAEGDRVASAEVEGSQTEAGSSSNEVSGAKVVNAAGEDVTGCYDITYAPGMLTVEAAPAEKGTLTSDLAGGTLDGKTGTITIVANVGDTVKLPGAPTREGYTFKYWKGSEYAAGAEYKVEGDHAFTAEWEKDAAATYTVTFDANGHGTAPAAQEVEDGKTAGKPANPTASGYTFGGWYTDKACKKAYDFSTPVTGDVTLYAEWTKKSSEGSSKSSTSPKTGDNLSFALPLVIALAAASALAMVLFRRVLRRRRG